MALYCTAIVAAAGRGRRMRCRIPKPFLKISGVPVIFHTLALLSKIPEIKDIILVLNPRDVQSFRARFIREVSSFKIAAIVAGGKERPDSIENALKALPEKCNVVCIHDAVRPNADAELIRKAINLAYRRGSAILAARIKDTIKKVTPLGEIASTINRKGLYLAQTPQVFRKDIILRAYNNRNKTNRLPTDDAELVEALGEKVFVIESNYDNIKITTPEDIVILNRMIKR